MTSTRKLVERACKEELGAFEELVQMYQDRVFSHCFRLTNNRDDAQDLSQEVFIQSFRAIKSFRHDADFGTWLHRITVNTWINWQRKQGKVLMFSLDEPVNTMDGEVNRELAATEESPLEVLERRELGELIRTALKRLLPDYRTAIILREIEGYTYEEIARILDCSLGTVKSRISRGRREIKKEIARLRCEYNEM